MSLHRVELTENDLKNIANKMEQLAKLPKDSEVIMKARLTKFDAIIYLANQIRNLLDKGWTYQEVTVFLKQEGLDISVSSLGTYLHRIKYK